MPPRVRVALRSPLVRTLVAIAFLAFHVIAITGLARERFDLPFNAEPTSAPRFLNPDTDPVPESWNRLAVSRWDSQHYITIALRGYSACKPREALGPEVFPDTDVTCQVGFFPGYSFLGWLVFRIAHVPIDYALFFVSIAASFVTLYLWTSDAIVESVGVERAYLSLLFLNVFTTAYELVSIQTEAPTLCLGLVAFVCLRRRWLIAGALAAGACSAIRITGLATGAAYGVALVTLVFRERPTNAFGWISRVVAALLCGWGIVTLFSLAHWRFGDGLIYFHSRARYYHYSLSPLSILHPPSRNIVEAICAAPNEGIWLAAGVLWYALGRKAGLSGFQPVERTFLNSLALFSIAMPAVAQVEMSFGGLSRYMLLAFPIFFAMAGAMRRRPLAAGAWIVFCLAHYYNVNLCFYEGQRMPGQLEKCSFGRAIQ